MYKTYKIGAFLKRNKTRVIVEDSTIYKQVTIRTHYKGVHLRGQKLGSSIGTKNQFIVSGGQFILSRIDARHGAFGIVPDHLEGAIVTNDFWAFDLNEDLIDLHYFYNLIQSPVFLEACVKASRGVTNRNRIQEDFFLGYKIELPDIHEQKQVSKRIRRAKQKFKIITYEISHQQTLLSQLKQAILQEAIQGKLTAEWRDQHPDVEPASTLLARIKEEKARLSAEGKIKKQKPLPPITEEEIPFELPEGWVWCRLGEIYEIVRGSSPRPKGDPRYWSDGRTDYHWIKIADFVPHGSEGILMDTNEFLTEEGSKHSRLVRQTDLLIAASGVGSVGKSIKLGIEGYIYDGLMAIRNIEDDTIRSFLSLFLKHKEYQIYSVASGANWLNINTGILSNYILALPPLDEIEIINQKMILLNRKMNSLEEQTVLTERDARRLMQAVLQEAFSGSSQQTVNTQ